MILKGSTTQSISHAGRLANHLLNKKDNDQVNVLEISGHETGDARHAMLLMHGAVTLTKGHKGCFQVSINPEPGEYMTAEQWDDAIARIEEEFKYTGQPKIVVEHTKEGRSHRHIVWQRTNFETETVIPIDDFKTRLIKQAREMEQEYGHRPVNDYSLAPQFEQSAYRQAKRNQDLNPKNRSAQIRELWENAETANSFVQALNDHGYQLATGNKSRFVLLHSDSGEILKGSLGRHLKKDGEKAVKASELRQWAEGLSTPLNTVEALKEELKAQREQAKEAQQNTDTDTKSGQSEVWDRDKYNEEWEEQVIDSAIALAEEEDEGEGDSRQLKPGKSVTEDFSANTGRSVRARSAADDYEDIEEAKKKAEGQMAKPQFKKTGPEQAGKWYKSYADQIDAKLQKEREEQSRLTARQAELEKYYRLDEQRKQIKELEQRLSSLGPMSKMLKRNQRLEERLEAKRKMLEDAQNRYKEAIVSYQGGTQNQAVSQNTQQQGPAPANDLESDQEREAFMKTRAHKREEGQDQSMDLGP